LNLGAAGSLPNLLRRCRRDTRICDYAGLTRFSTLERAETMEAIDLPAAAPPLYSTGPVLVKVPDEAYCLSLKSLYKSLKVGVTAGNSYSLALADKS
jgi:hypothetical protein